MAQCLVGCRLTKVGNCLGIFPFFKFYLYFCGFFFILAYIPIFMRTVLCDTVQCTVLHNDSIRSMTRLMFMSTRKRNWPKQNKKLENKTQHISDFLSSSPFKHWPKIWTDFKFPFPRALQQR